MISSFSHNEVDLNRSGGRGVQLLKAYLEYAANGGRRLPEEGGVGKDDLNPFEADVRNALEARGIVMRPQFGSSRCRIDLVAMHPRKSGWPVLAIECDGASYHSSATARDRDRLRQAHLQRLGWRFHRIWSTDWFFRREQEIERAISAYEEAVRRADLSDADTVPRAHPEEEEAAAEVPRWPSAGQRGVRPRVPIRQMIDQYSERELLQIAEWVASDGLLRTDEELMREIFDTLPFQRMGGRIRERLQQAIEIVRRRERRRSSGQLVPAPYWGVQCPLRGSWNLSSKIPPWRASIEPDSPATLAE